MYQHPHAPAGRRARLASSSGRTLLRVDMDEEGAFDILHERRSTITIAAEKNVEVANQRTTSIPKGNPSHRKKARMNKPGRSARRAFAKLDEEDIFDAALTATSDVVPMNAQSNPTDGDVEMPNADQATPKEQSSHCEWIATAFVRGFICGLTMTGAMMVAAGLLSASSPNATPAFTSSAPVQSPVAPPFVPPPAPPMWAVYVSDYDTDGSEMLLLPPFSPGTPPIPPTPPSPSLPTSRLPPPQQPLGPPQPVHPPRALSSLTAMDRVRATLSAQYDGSNSYGAERCINDIDDDETDFCHSSMGGGRGMANPWLSVELPSATATIGFVRVFNRVVTDQRYCRGCLDRLGKFELWVGSTLGAHEAPAIRCAQVEAPASAVPLLIACNGQGRFLTLLLPGTDRVVNLAEVQIFRNDQPSMPPMPPLPPGGPPPPPCPQQPPSLPPPPPLPEIPPDEGVAYDLYTGWEFYRLGDMVAMWGERRSGCSQAECTSAHWANTVEDFHCSAWPASLACRYCRATNEENNYKALADIIQNVDSANTPEADVAVAHLRVGDVLSDNWLGAGGSSVERILDGPPICSGVWTNEDHGGETRRCYIKNLAYYDIQIRKLPPSVRTVYLVAGSHHRGGYQRSSDYIRGVRNFFNSKGFRVHLRLGGSPDEDVVFMSRAKHFIQGGGGFSILLAGVVKEMGGTVLTSDPIFG